MSYARPTVRREDLLYPDLSYDINGALFEVFRQLGGGHDEKYFQKATADSLRNRQIQFVEQYYVPIKFNDGTIGRYYLDFLVEGKIVLELKRGKFVPAKIIDQVTKYLDVLDLELALVACFTHEGVSIKRIINPTKVPKTIK